MVISAKIDVMNVLQSPPPANRVEMLRLFNKGGVVAEIGVQCGEYAQHIYDVLQPREFYLIDCWEKQSGSYSSDPSNRSDHEAMHRVASARFSKRPGCHIIKAYSHDAVNNFADGFFDFVYLDADHTHDAVLNDLRAWWPKVKTGGVLAGHDYVKNRPDRPWIRVAQALSTWGREPDLLTREHPTSWAIWKV